MFALSFFQTTLNLREKRFFCFFFFSQRVKTTHSRPQQSHSHFAQKSFTFALLFKMFEAATKSSPVVFSSKSSLIVKIVPLEIIVVDVEKDRPKSFSDKFIFLLLGERDGNP